MKDLRGRHAIVTGASRGIGVVIAEALAEQGMNLTLAARSRDELEVTRSKVEYRGVRACVVSTDVAQPSDRQHLVDTAREALGPIDVLVNNAGLEGLGRFTDLTPDEIERVVAVNLTGSLLLTWLVLPEMLERSSGHIVNIASVAGKGGGPFEVVYSATKAGIVGASEALRAELAGTGVMVSTVCPGFVEREGMYARHAVEAGIHASRWLGTTTPEKVAAAVLHAIEHDAPELVVNPGPFRLLLALGDLLPAIKAPVTNWLSYRTLRDATARQHDEHVRPLAEAGPHSR